MNQSVVTSLAILMVNENEHKDFYDNFVPMVAECIRKSSENVISIGVVQQDIKRYFGLDVPQSVIKSIIRRKLKPAGFVTFNSVSYVPNRATLNQIDFQSIQHQVLEQHEIIIEQLSVFAEKKFQISWSNQEAELALEAFLRDNEIIILNALEYNEKIDGFNYDVKESKFIVARYIQELQQNHSSAMAYLEAVVKGNIIANAIYAVTPSDKDRKFKNFEVYFDTSILIYALGYADTPRQEPITELIALLKEQGTLLRCFRHNVDEVVGILDTCKYRLNNRNYVDNHGTMEYFITKKSTPADIERCIQNLDYDLRKLGINVVDTPSYKGTHLLNIDHTALKSRLREAVPTYKEAALEKDVESIQAIVRLRNGKTSIHIETCGSVFVTSNVSLAKQTREFFIHDHNIRTIPPVILENTLTNQLWLKKPTAAPSLPRKRIIADCLAATQPHDYIWKKYLDKIDELKGEHQISADEYYLLRCTQEAKSLLMDKTLGNEEVITYATVEEILELTKASIVQEYKDALYATNEKVIQQQSEVETVIAENESLQSAIDKMKLDSSNKINNQSLKYANRFILLIHLAILLLLALGESLTLSEIQKSLPNWLIITIDVVFLISVPIMGLYGVTIIGPITKLRDKIAAKRKVKLTKLYG